MRPNDDALPHYSACRELCFACCGGVMIDLGLINVAGTLETITPYFVTVHARPSSFASPIEALALPCHQKTCLIVQGPLAAGHYTHETLKLYKALFPGAAVVLSTWKDEDPDALDAIRGLGVEVITNEKPANPGVANINFQIRSSQAAVAWAEGNGLEYCLKTRTDYRIYDRRAIRFLFDLLDAFPLRSPRTGQKARLAFLSDNTQKYRVYSATDFMVFGTTQDMARYWNVPEDERGKDWPVTETTIGEWSRSRYAEVKLFATYVEALGFEPDFTIRQYWQVLADHCIVFDSSTVDAYWRKYLYNAEHRYRHYGPALSSDTLTFADWLNLYVSNRVPDIDERIQDLRWGAVIHDAVPEVG